MPGRWTSLGRSPSHRSDRSSVLSPPPQPSDSGPIRACTGPSCTSTSPFHSLTSQLRLRLLLPPTFRLIFVLEKTPPGSSPLARGTLDEPPRVPVLVRFIPARAGNTRIWSRNSKRSTVHPRSRGEHVVNVLPLCRENGSSPLARGTPAITRTHDRAHRFIPARAGNTGLIASILTLTLVHPRSRGEHSDMPGHAGAFAGSSPLARGTRCPELIPPHFYRFIPARAGNTRAPRIRAPSAPVHPRSRGEHIDAITA